MLHEIALGQSLKFVQSVFLVERPNPQNLTSTVLPSLALHLRRSVRAAFPQVLLQLPLTHSPQE